MEKKITVELTEKEAIITQTALGNKMEVLDRDISKETQPARKEYFINEISNAESAWYKIRDARK